MELQTSLQGSREGKGTRARLPQASGPVLVSGQMGATSNLGGGPRPAALPPASSSDFRMGGLRTQSGPRARENGTRTMPAIRAKADRHYTEFRSWQRKPGETGRHSLGDSLLQVGVCGGRREGVTQPGRTVQEEKCGSLTLPRAPSPTRGSELGCRDPRPPPGSPPRPLPGHPPGPAAGNGGARGGRGKSRLRAGGRAQWGGGVAPGPEGAAARLPTPPLRRAPGRPPGLPARSPPSWRRPCRRSAPPARPAAPAEGAARGPPCR